MPLGGLFGLTLQPLELVVRGTAVYLFLFVLFRFVLRRDAGSLSMADVLLVALIADASQNALSGTYTSIGDGMLLVATIAAWNLLLDWAEFRFERVRRLLEPRPLLLVRSGRLLRANLRRQWVTVTELEAKLREEGIDRWDDVERAYMEGDGQISVIRRERDTTGETDATEATDAGAEPRRPADF